MNGTISTFEVETDETIHHLKTRIQDNLGIPPEQQRLIYSGKELKDEKILSNFNVRRESRLHLILRHRVETPPSTVPIESIFPGRVDAKASIQAWKTKAQQGGFDSDICIVDPQAHYTELSCLEQDVVLNSEYFHRLGANSTISDNNTYALLQRHNSLGLVPAWMWAFIHSDSAA